MSDANKHTCGAIMTTKPAVIKQSESVAKAMRMLLDNRLLGLPVVDGDGRYLGMFLRSRLVALLLPRIVQLEESMPEVARLVEVGFMSDTLDDAHERFDTVANDPVGKYLHTNTPILRRDTPVMNAVLYPLSHPELSAGRRRGFRSAPRRRLDVGHSRQDRRQLGLTDQPPRSTKKQRRFGGIRHV